MFKRLLIANRGEIALRIIRSCREMGIETVAVYSEADRIARHVQMADKAVPIGHAAAADSYLNIERVIDACQQTGAEAIHPGYGFLSENAELVDACNAAGICFVGPTAAVMRLMGDKASARKAAEEGGLSVVPGDDAGGKGFSDAATAKRAAERLGYPIMLKARAGGGGKGMRSVNSEEHFVDEFESAQREAKRAFGDQLIYLERCLKSPRHIEVQLVGDQRGRVVHLGERDCSIQRRHQKVIEETPSPVLSAQQRQTLGESAARFAAEIGYHGAGTVEFLYDEGQFYFIEMNTRLQVEHPITEWCFGVDLVRMQLEIAAGEAVLASQDKYSSRGHAIECRICAEDATTFLPSPGTVSLYAEPGGPGVRCDSAVDEGGDVPAEYDSLLAKLSVYGTDRSQAVARLRRALSEYAIAGVHTNLAFLRKAIETPEFTCGQYDTRFIERHPQIARCEQASVGAEIAAAVDLWYRSQSSERRRRQEDISNEPSAWRRSVRG